MIQSARMMARIINTWHDSCWSLIGEVLSDFDDHPAQGVKASGGVLLSWLAICDEHTALAMQVGHV